MHANILYGNAPELLIKHDLSFEISATHTDVFGMLYFLMYLVVVFANVFGMLYLLMLPVTICMLRTENLQLDLCAPSFLLKSECNVFLCLPHCCQALLTLRHFSRLDRQTCMAHACLVCCICILRLHATSVMYCMTC